MIPISSFTDISTKYLFCSEAYYRVFCKISRHAPLSPSLEIITIMDHYYHFPLKEGVSAAIQHWRAVLPTPLIGCLNGASV